MVARLVLSALALAGVTTPSTALPGESRARSDIIAVIEAQRVPIEQNKNGSFSGAGWRRLIEDAATAQFTMIGEQHGSGSIANFETALHKELAARGYTHSALEIGPFSTSFAEQLVRRRHGALAEYLAQDGYGFAIPFLFFDEETRMAEQMVAASPDPQAALWGLDQEFIGGGPLHADLLAARARTSAQKNAVKSFRQAAMKDRFFSGTVDDNILNPVRKAFALDPEALELISALDASSAIYRPFVKRNAGDVLSANLARETMMKRNFLDAFADAERRQKRPPKVFLKFGANHAMRGFSDTNVPALGNFLAEWGLSRNMRMVNLLVECDGGEALNPQDNKPGPCEPYFGADSLLQQALKTGPAIQMYDLRPLRPRLAKWNEIDPASRKVILSFDYYVTIRNGRAARPVGQLQWHQ